MPLEEWTRRLVESISDRKSGSHFRAYKCRSSCSNVNGTPNRARLREQVAVGRAEYFGVTLEAKLRRFSDPCSGDDVVPPKSGLLVIDLVAQHDPEKSGQFAGGRFSLPMCDRCVLDPAHVSDVVDVPDLIDVRVFNANWKFERPDCFDHPFSMGSGGMEADKGQPTVD